MSQNLQNVVKFQKFQLENLVEFEKCCKTRIFLQRSVSIQPKTSNCFCRNFADRPPRRRPALRGTPRSSAPPPRSVRAALGFAKLSIFFANFLASSFSAVSKREFSRKYAFDSIFQSIQDVHTYAPLQTQKFNKKRFEKSVIFVQLIF